jgi:hypothetical protein
MRLTSTTPGLIMAISPSYFIQESIMEELLQQKFDRTILEETRGMSREEKRKLKDEIKLGGDVLVMTVQIP